MDNYKGAFNTLRLLQIKHPVGKTGWFAFVNSIQYIWDDIQKSWLSNSETLGGLQGSYYLNESNHTRDITLVTGATGGTGSISIDNPNRIIKVDTTYGDETVILPTAIGFIGKFDIIKTDSSNNSIFIIGILGQTISGETTQEIFGQYDNITIISDNSNWLII